MTETFFDGPREFHVNGKQQFMIEDIKWKHEPKMEVVNRVESVNPAYRHIKDEGTGEITFAMTDEDDYGPAELLGFIIGYNDYNTATNQWEITDMDLTTSPTSPGSNLLRYMVDRQHDDTGSDVTLTFGGTASDTLVYQARGETISKICLNFTDIASIGACDITITSTASSETAYIPNADIIGTGETWYTLRNAGDTADLPIATYVTTHDSMVTDTLTIEIVGGGASETVDLAANSDSTKVWNQILMYNETHLDIVIRCYDSKAKAAYRDTILDDVFFKGATLKAEPHKTPRATMKFIFEDISYATG